MNNVDTPSVQMINEAAHWLAALNDEHVSTQQRQAFEDWRSADPRHALALARMQSLWGSLDGVSAAPARSALRQVFRRPVKRSGLARSLPVVAMLALLGSGWASWQQAPLWLADQRTGVGERRQLILEDGSELKLNSQSAVDIHYDAEQRVIELLRGELWVEVAKDPSRPFVVRTAEGTVTALGTRFLVRHGDEGVTLVSVTESAVSVQPQSAAAVKVSAGEQAQMRDDHAQTPSPLAGNEPDAWTRGVLKVDDRPLSEVLESLASYRRGVLSFDAQALQGLRVSGVLRLGDSDAALATLADNLPIEVEYFTPWLVRVTARR